VLLSPSTFVGEGKVGGKCGTPELAIPLASADRLERHRWIVPQVARRACVSSSPWSRKTWRVCWPNLSYQQVQRQDDEASYNCDSHEEEGSIPDGNALRNGDTPRVTYRVGPYLINRIPQSLFAQAVNMFWGNRCSLRAYSIAFIPQFQAAHRNDPVAVRPYQRD
jgi:hypothetical protein